MRSEPLEAIDDYNKEQRQADRKQFSAMAMQGLLVNSRLGQYGKQERVIKQQ